MLGVDEECGLLSGNVHSWRAGRRSRWLMTSPDGMPGPDQVPTLPRSVQYAM